MSNELLPLHYAIIKHFENGVTACAQDVVAALEPAYSNYKLLSIHDVEETLATAKENGILEETDCTVNDDGNLTFYYRLTDFGKDMVGKYLK